MLYGGLCAVWRIMCCIEECVLYGGLCAVWRIMCCMEDYVLYGGLCAVWKIMCCIEDCVLYGECVMQFVDPDRRYRLALARCFMKAS